MIRKTRNVAMLSALVVLVLLLCLPAGPAAGAIYYVSTDGNDASAGTSPKLAWRTITHAAKQAQAGDMVMIRGGDYGFEQIVMENSGTPEAPIRFIGYDGQVRLEGKVEKVTKGRQKGKMRLAGSGVSIRGSYIKVSGITVLRYGGPIGVGGHHNTLERCTAGIGGWGAIVVGGHHNEVRHCTAYNATMYGIGVKRAHDITIADCWSYSDRCVGRMFPGMDIQSDYCYAVVCGRNIHFTRCRGDRRDGGGHGMCFAATNVDKTAPDSFKCTNCRVTDCEMYNAWEHFGVRQGSHDITFENCYCRGIGAKRSDHGFYYRAGVYNIVVKNCRAKDVEAGLDASENGKSLKQCGVTRNITFENCIATHCTIGIRLQTPNSRVINCLSARNDRGMQIGGTRPKVAAACKELGVSLEKTVKGCIVCENKVGIVGGPITHCNVWGNKTDYAKGAKPGEGCISKDPQFVNKGKRHKPDYGVWYLKDTSPCKDMGPYAADPKASIGLR